MTAPDPVATASLFEAAITAWSQQRPRTRQTEDRKLGSSDVGFCREYARLLLNGTEFTDSPSTWAADVGTWVHSGVDSALGSVFDKGTWLMGERDNLNVTARIGDWEIPGHPDLIDLSTNTVWDLKTKDGLYGVSATLSHRYQRALYALGAQQDGLLQAGPIYAGNIYVDRSGKTKTPVVDVEEVTTGLLDEIAVWLEDVRYALDNNEEASKDIVPMVCEKICAFFTVCRATEDWRGSGVIDDPELIEKVTRYYDANLRFSEAKREKSHLKRQLQTDEEKEGVAGVTPEHVVRWTSVPPTETTAGYWRLDVRPRRN